MANKAHPSSKPAKSKSRAVVTDNRQARSPAMIQKLMDLGVPRQLAATFALTPHPTKRWCKKIKGKLWLFGSFVDGWQKAIDTYREQIEDILAGRTPQARNKDGLRLIDLLNQFLHAKRSKVTSGELTMRSWYDYQQCGERLLKVLGKDRLVEDLGPSDFEALRADFGKTWGPVRIGNEVNRTRVIFRYAFEQGLLDRPIRFGEFKRTDKKTLRKHRAKQKAQHGARMFSAEEVHQILTTADPCMKSMVLLGINGGLNNADVATLYFEAVDLDKGWLDFPRGKTGVPRRIPLWPETVTALRAWLAVRPEPKNEADKNLVFLTRQRRPWYRLGRFVADEKGAEVVKGIDNPVSKSFRVLLDKIGLNGRRNFLALRHGFRTIGRGARDREAIDALMGHVDETMAGHYIEDGLPDERLRAVTEHVRHWLLSGKKD